MAALSAPACRRTATATLPVSPPAPLASRPSPTSDLESFELAEIAGPSAEVEGTGGRRTGDASAEDPRKICSLDVVIPSTMGRFERRGGGSVTELP